jgi:hypothetical protein
MSAATLTPREAYEKACHYDNVFNDGVKYYQINYWGRIYTHLHPKNTTTGTEGRAKCMSVLTKALQYHLDNTINGDERAKIMAAQREIAKYS